MRLIVDHPACRVMVDYETRHQGESEVSLPKACRGSPVGAAFSVPCKGESEVASPYQIQGLHLPVLKYHRDSVVRCKFRSVLENLPRNLGELLLASYEVLGGFSEFLPEVRYLFSVSSKGRNCASTSSFRRRG